MPAELTAAERIVWTRLVPRIIRLGVVAEVDRPLLVDLVKSLVRLEEAERDISVRGVLVDGDRGKVKNPAVQIARDYRQAVLALSARFGLSPIDRERLRLTLASAERAERIATRPSAVQPPEAVDPRQYLRDVSA